MITRHTHTVATLGVSEGAYAEVAQLLRDAGYDHVFLDDNTIDMTGIGLAARKESPFLECDNCQIKIWTSGPIQMGEEHPCPSGGIGHWRLVTPAVADEESVELAQLGKSKETDRAQIARGRKLAEDCFGQVRSQMDLDKMTWLNGEQWNALGAYVAAVSIDEDERKALLQLAAAMVAYRSATGLSHAMGMLIRDAARYRASVATSGAEGGDAHLETEARSG